MFDNYLPEYTPHVLHQGGGDGVLSYGKAFKECSFFAKRMKRGSRRWKKPRQMRWKWQRKRMRKEKRRRRMKQ